MKKLVFLIAVLLLVSSNISWAGPWPQASGKGFFKVDYTWIQAKDVFNDKAEVSSIFGTLNHSIISFYGEYGLSNRFTLIAYCPLLVQNQFKSDLGNSPRHRGNGDIDVALKFGILVNKPVVLSATLLLGAPTGNHTDKNYLFTGDGEFNQMLKFDAGTSGKNWWASLGGGFNKRSKGASDELRYDAELGIKLLNEHLFIALKANIVQSLNNGDPTENNLGLFANNTSYIGFNPEVSVNFTQNFGASVRMGLAAYGKNVPAAPAYAVGVYYKM